MDKLLMWVLTNASTLDIVVYLLLTMVFAGYAFHKEWVVLGKVYEPLKASYDALVLAADTVEDKLTDQRILNERATVTIEHLTAENQRLTRERERLDHELQLERARASRKGN